MLLCLLHLLKEIEGALGNNATVLLSGESSGIVNKPDDISLGDRYLDVNSSKLASSSVPSSASRNNKKN